MNFDPANASHTAMVESMGGRWSNAGEAIVQADDPEPDPPSPSPASPAAEPPAAPSPGPTTTPGGPAPKRPGPTRIGLGPEEPSSVHPAKLHLEREAQQAGASAYRPPPPQGAAAPAPSTPPANDEGSELAVPVAPNRAPLMVVAVVLLVAAIAGARFLL